MRIFNCLGCCYSLSKVAPYFGENTTQSSAELGCDHMALIDQASFNCLEDDALTSTGLPACDRCHEKAVNEYSQDTQALIQELSECTQGRSDLQMRSNLTVDQLPSDEIFLPEFTPIPKLTSIEEYPIKEPPCVQSSIFTDESQILLGQSGLSDSFILGMDKQVHEKEIAQKHGPQSTNEGVVESTTVLNRNSSSMLENSATSNVAWSLDTLLNQRTSRDKITLREIQKYIERGNNLFQKDSLSDESRIEVIAKYDLMDEDDFFLLIREHLTDTNARFARNVIHYTTDLRVVALLLEKGISVDTYDEIGRTPLFLAIDKLNIPLIRYLLGEGADPYLARPLLKSGKTALDGPSTPLDLLLGKIERLDVLRSCHIPGLVLDNDVARCQEILGMILSYTQATDNDDVI